METVSFHTGAARKTAPGELSQSKTNGCVKFAGVADTREPSIPLSETSRRAILAAVSRQDDNMGALLKVSAVNNAFHQLSAGKTASVAPAILAWSAGFQNKNLSAPVFSPDGEGLAFVGQNGDVRVVGDKGEKWLADRVGNAPFHPPAFSPDGSKIAFQTCGGHVYLMRGGTEPVIWNRYVGKIMLDGSVAFSPDGNKIAVGSHDAQMLILDAASGKTRLTIPVDEKTNSAPVFSPDSSKVAVATVKLIKKNGKIVRPDHKLEMFDAQTGKQVWSLVTDHGSVLHYVSFSPDGKRIATAINLGGNLSEIRMMDAADGKLLWRKRVRSSLETVPSFSPDGKKVAVASFDHLRRSIRVDLFTSDKGARIGIGMSAPIDARPKPSPPFFKGETIKIGTTDDQGNGGVYLFDAGQLRAAAEERSGSRETLALKPESVRILGGVAI